MTKNYFFIGELAQLINEKVRITFWDPLYEGSLNSKNNSDIQVTIAARGKSDEKYINTKQACLFMLSSESWDYCLLKKIKKKKFYNQIYFFGRKTWNLMNVDTEESLWMDRTV